MNFYRTANASRSVKLPGGSRKAVTFEVYDYFAGAWLGCAAVEDPETIAGLDELAGNVRSGIVKITESDYKACLKKKPAPLSSPRLVASPLLPPQAAIIQDRADRPAAKVVVNSAEAPAAPVPSTLTVYDSLDQVLQIGAVKPAVSSPVPAKPKKDVGERSARATSTSPSRRPKYQSDIPPQPSPSP